jgi:two-component system cell cycle response regulator
MTDTSIQILLVEDNAAYAVLLKKEFQDSSLGPFAVTHVARLFDALGLMRSRRFDAVLLDLELSDSRGIVTLEQMLREKTRSCALKPSAWEPMTISSKAY